MKKKAIIISTSIIGIIALIIILMFTVFYIKSVSFNALNQNDYDTSTISVKKSGVVFFVNKQEMISDIEKQHPYINVINIETVFPNKLVVHYATREETFAFKDKNKDVVYVVDDEMVVLKIMNTDVYTSTQSNAILVENVVILNTNVLAGDILQIDFDRKQNIKNNQQYFQTFIESISDAFLMNNKDVASQRALVKNMYFEYDEIHYITDGNGVVLNIVTFDDFLIKIYNPDNQLEVKLQYMLSSLPNCVPDYLDNGYLEILEDNNKEIFAKISLKA